MVLIHSPVLDFCSSACMGVHREVTRIVENLGSLSGYEWMGGFTHIGHAKEGQERGERKKHVFFGKFFIFDLTPRSVRKEVQENKNKTAAAHL